MWLWDWIHGPQPLQDPASGPDITSLVSAIFAAMVAQRQTSRIRVNQDITTVASPTDHSMGTGADLVSADRHFEVVDGIVWLELDNHWHWLHLNQWRKKRARERRCLDCGAAISHRTQNVFMCEGYVPEHRL